MRMLTTILLYGLIVLCGAFAVIDVMDRSGNAGAFIMIIAGLCLVLYIMRLPVEFKNP